MSLNLNSQNNQFYFQLPIDFVPNEIEARYKPQLDIFHSAYDTIVDFLNSTLKSMTFPSLNFPTVTQNKYQGKEIAFRGGMNPYDTFQREFSIEFKSVSNHLNYLIIQDIMLFHYINTRQKRINPFILIILDQNRNPVWEYEFKEIIPTDLSSFTFDYSDVNVEQKTFTVGFKCNYIEPKYVDPERPTPEMKPL